MKPKIRTPYFEIGTKNYIYGDKVLICACRGQGAEKYDIDVLFIDAGGGNPPGGRRIPNT